MHIFITYLHAEYWIHGSTDSLVVTMKHKAKYRFVAAIIMIFSIVLKFYPLPRFWIFFEIMLPHKIWGFQSTDSHSVGSIDGRKLNGL
jgi:hypothetical protein